MNSELFYKNPKTILNKGTGFLAGYTHSLNPYTGCSFACSYCYVRQMPVSLFRKKEWGSWVDIKQNAAIVLEKELKRAKSKGEVTIFMSSSTDPYQPVENKERLTRSLLETMLQHQPDFLFVQTRSPLVKRDIDLLKLFKNKVRVSMTIETDLDEIRKIFSPFAPPINARLKTLEELAKEGIPTQATIAPVLPSSEDFPIKLSKIVNRVCIDDFFMGDGSGGKRTTRLGIETKYKEHKLEEWYDSEAYLLVYERFKKYFSENQLFISQKGFEP
ncbi:radical SAM protein [Bacillus sp. AFS002410]|uniref:SPL family radical SAM protein n=1 Tax=Bacillus sp. AFS002410 TaxID=2033481 RepID=UPI000BF218C7|nr:radical SAM protein [Bacillus sp. AFS002410]PEJ53311.1 radical SAM protein [Bacillus sp. AFS002410]